MPAGRKTLSRYLADRRRTLEGIDAARDPAAAVATLLERYQLLVVSGLDYKGQLSSAYGEKGVAATLSAGFDLGSAVLPGFLTAGITASTGVQALSKSLVVLQRMPHALFNAGDLMLASAAAAGQNAPRTPLSPVWRTATPVSLAMLEGSVYTGSLSLKAEVGAGVGLPVATDELGLDLSLSANLSGTVQGTLLRLHGIHRSSYPSPRTDGARQAINARLSALLPAADVRRIISDWCQAKRRQYRLLAPQSQVRQPVVRTLRFIHTPGQGTLLQDLNDLHQLLDTAINSQARAPLQLVQDRRQAFEFIGQINMLETEGAPPAGARPYPETYLRLYAMSGEVGAGAGAGVGAGGGVNLSGAQFNLGATAGVSARAQFVSYRYQTTADGTDGAGQYVQPLIVTQDTYISYRQVDASAQALADVDISLDRGSGSGGVGRGRDRNLYNTMTYQSIVTFWPSFGPDHRGQVYPQIQIAPWSGSGIVYGCSASIRRLQAAIKSPTAQGNGKFLANLARQLRVSPAVLLDFLRRTNLTTLDPRRDLDPQGSGNPLTHVFLESSFAFDTTVLLRGRRQQTRSGAFLYELDDPFKNQSVQAFVGRLTTSPPPGATTGGAAQAAPPAHPRALEALRVRVRIDDTQASDRTLFPLGFNAGLSFGINISAIRGAGQEGFFDLFVYWYNNAAYNQDAHAQTGQERSVPPVALLHQ